MFSKTIDTSQDMAILEDMLRALLGKENSKKCSFMRSKEYIAFRLMVLYKKEVLQAPMVVYSEGVKICLNPDWCVDVFMLERGVDNDMTSILGKRDGSDLEKEDVQRPNIKEVADS